MSGRSVAHILEQHGGDVYITGSTVVRHKVVNGVERAVFPADCDTQLVLTAKYIYKLRQFHSPPLEKQQRVREEHQPTTIEESRGRAALVVQPPLLKLVWRESLGLVRAVVSLQNHPFHEWAAEKNIPRSNCCGFAIEYFNLHATAPKPASKQTLFQRYVKEKRCRCVDDVFVDVQLTSGTTRGSSGKSNDTNGGLRVREFHLGLLRPQPDSPQTTGDGSLFLQQDWCLAFRVGRMNYWHERLEDNLIDEPEVFQYQLFAMEFPSDNRDLAGANVATSGKVRPLLCQLVLSTERLYVVPRHNSKLLSLELPLHHPEMRLRWFTIAALQSLSFDSNKGIIVCTGQQQQQQEKRVDQASVRTMINTNSNTNMSSNFSSPGIVEGGFIEVKLTLGFFDTAEAEEAVLEIQRLWELTHRHDDFPLV